MRYPASRNSADAADIHRPNIKVDIRAYRFPFVADLRHVHVSHSFAIGGKTDIQIRVLQSRLIWQSTIRSYDSTYSPSLRSGERPSGAGQLLIKFEFVSRQNQNDQSYTRCDAETVE
jgi:hypothetical protein